MNINIKEFLEGQELTLYANKRLESNMDEMQGKLKIILKSISPFIFLITVNFFIAKTDASFTLMTVLSVVFGIMATYIAFKGLKRLEKVDRVNVYELEELVDNHEKVKFVHENLSYDNKVLTTFEKTVATISKFRSNVTCEPTSLEVPNLVIVDKHSYFDDIIFKDLDTDMDFLVSIKFNNLGKATMYAEYPLVKGYVDLENVQIKEVI